MTQLEQIKEEVRKFALERTNLDLGWTDCSNVGLLEGCPIFRRAGEKVLFGYSYPPGGIVFNKVSKAEVLIEDAAPPTQDVQPEQVDGDACEIMEISPDQWERVADHANHPMTTEDPDTDWLVRAGVASVTPAGNVELTTLGKQWLLLDRPRIDRQ